MTDLDEDTLDELDWANRALLLWATTIHHTLQEQLSPEEPDVDSLTATAMGEALSFAVRHPELAHKLQEAMMAPLGLDPAHYVAQADQNAEAVAELIRHEIEADADDSK